ncbi:hypothetical protein JYU20_00480 [Bacteroidales bacterium AH-315-I05]|nr:hypothetical protein [Bacteroidales bacterium AH-315-I05]
MAAATNGKDIPVLGDMTKAVYDVDGDDIVDTSATTENYRNGQEVIVGVQANLRIDFKKGGVNTPFPAGTNYILDFLDGGIIKRIISEDDAGFNVETYAGGTVRYNATIQK